jgi:hypothetical protein
MAHCVWWFICALPSPAQRISKALQVVQSLLLLPSVLEHAQSVAEQCTLLLLDLANSVSHLQFLVTIPAVGITAIVNEATAASALAMVALKGVSSDDAKLASRAISKGVSGRIYPEVLEQRETTALSIFSFLLSPFPFCFIQNSCIFKHPSFLSTFFWQTLTQDALSRSQRATATGETGHSHKWESSTSH